MNSSPRLHIRDVQARAVVAPLTPPVRTASGSVTQALLVLIDLHTEEGPVGRAYLFAYQPFALRPLRDLVLGLGATIKGQPVAPLDLERAMRARFTLLGARGLQGMAVAGIDMAAWDALAVATGVPLATLLGGEARPIPAYNSLGMLAPGEAADEAAKSVAAGFRGVKIKIGWPSLDQDLASVRAARRALPDDVALMVDFNQSLTVVEALRRGRALDGEGVAWIEEPVRADDFRGAAEVAAALATPVQIGENLAGPFQMEEALRSGQRSRHARRPADRRRHGLAPRGGPRPRRRRALLEPPVHRGQRPPSRGTPTCHWIEYLDMAGPILAEPLRPLDGTLQAPPRPGLGIAWDKAAVQRYLVS